MKKKSTQRIAAWLLAAGMMAGTFAQPMAVYAESTASIAASDSTTGDSITADADVVIATPTPEPDTGTDTAATPVPTADSQTPQDPASTAAPETTPAPDAAEDAPTPTPTPAAEDAADDAADTDDTTDTTTTVTPADLQSCIALLAASQLSLDADSIEPDVREETLALSDEITETEPSTLQAVVNAAVYAAPAGQTDITVKVPANNYTGTLVIPDATIVGKDDSGNEINISYTNKNIILNMMTGSTLTVPTDAAVGVSVFGSLTIQGGTIKAADGCTATRGVQVQLGSALTLDGTTISDFTYAGPGAGVYVKGTAAVDTNGQFDVALGENQEPLQNADNTYQFKKLRRENDTEMDTSFTMKGGTTITNCKSDGNGAALYVHNAALLTLESANFTTNNAGGFGGAVYLGTGVQTTIGDGVTFTGNHAAKDGGALYLANQYTLHVKADNILVQVPVTFNGGTFTDNSTDTYGGALAFDPAFDGIAGNTIANVTFGQAETTTSEEGDAEEETTLHGNYAALRGGAIAFNSNIKENTLKNCTFRGNTALRYAGAVYYPNTYGKTTVFNPVYTVDGCTFDRNSATYDVKNGDDAGGGAILIQVNPTDTPNTVQVAKLYVKGSTFTQNTATGYGGAISTRREADRGNARIYLNIDSSKFDSNRATSAGNGGWRGGGAVWVAGHAWADFTANTFTGNYSARFGGAIATNNDNVYQGRVITLGALQEDGTPDPDKANTFTNNSANSWGGAISTGASSSGDNTNGIYTTVRIYGGSFAGNTTLWGSGGALYVASGNQRNDLGLEVIGTTFTENKATHSADAGAVYLYGITSSFKDCEFTANSTEQTHGGAMYIRRTKRFDLDNVTFTGNIAATTRGTGYGGAIYINDCPSSIGSTFTWNNVTFDSNTSRSAGGAVTADTNTYLNLIATKITARNNKGTTGGAFYLNQGCIALTDAVFEKNTANGSGGAIYMRNRYSGNSLTIKGSSRFVGNTASSSGGALYFDQNDITYTDDDGQLQYRRGELNITGTADTPIVFSGNIAKNYNGGAIAVGFSNTDKLDYLDVHDNTAKQYGGGIYVNGGATVGTLTNSKIYNNTTVQTGGGVFVYAYFNYQNVKVNNVDVPTRIGEACDFTIENCEVTGNSTTGTDGSSLGGGGIAMGADLRHSKFFSDDSGTLNIINTTVGNNTSGTSGGGVYGSYNTTIKISGSKIANNTAASNGGGVVVRNNTTTIKNDTVIEGNTAGANGGALYTWDTRNNNEKKYGVYEPKLTTEDCTIANNTAKKGGIAYVSAGASFAMGKKTSPDSNEGVGDVFVEKDAVKVTLPAAKKLEGEYDAWLMDNTPPALETDIANDSSAEHYYTLQGAAHVVARLNGLLGSWTGKEYTTLQAALDEAATKTGTASIDLLADVGEQVTATTVHNPITLNLNGYTLTGKITLTNGQNTNAFTLTDEKADKYKAGSAGGVLTGPANGIEMNKGKSSTICNTLKLKGKTLTLTNMYRGVSATSGYADISAVDVTFTQITNGGVYTSGGYCNVQVANVTYTNNTGNAFLVGSGRNILTVDNANIYNNKISGNGLLWLGDNSTLIINGGSFHDNTVSNNGTIAYANSVGCTITINGGEFYNNKAANGGVVYMPGNDTLTINGGNFYNNTATGSGGAIVQGNGNVNVNMTINGGDFHDNNAVNGGAIYMGTNTGLATLTMIGGKIYNNTANNGGAVYIPNKGNVTLSAAEGAAVGGIIRDNTASQLASNLYLGGAGSSLTVGEKTLLYGGTIAGDVLFAQGGTVDLADTQDLHTDGIENAEDLVWLKNDKETGDKAVRGAAESQTIYTLAPAGENTGSYAARIGSDKYFSINQAIKAMEAADAEDAETNTTTIHLLRDQTEDVTINNTKHSPTLNLNGYTLTGHITVSDLNKNTRTFTMADDKTQGDYKQGSTGGVLTAASGTLVNIKDQSYKPENITVKLQGVTLDGANTNRGVLAARNTNLVAVDTTFSNNTLTASGAAGAAIGYNGYNDSSTLAVTNCTFTNNRAENSYGGAIYMNRATDTAIIENCTFEDNYAQNQGGAVYLNAHAITLRGNRFAGNTSKSQGGAVYLVPNANTEKAETEAYGSYDAVLQNNTFANNKAVGNGGALYVKAPSITVTELMDRCTFTNNSTATGGGGAVYHEQGSLTLGTGNLFKENKSFGGGSGMYVGGKLFSVRDDENVPLPEGGYDTQFISNTAGYGNYNGGHGALNVGGGATKNMRYMLFDDNVAAYGDKASAIYVGNTGSGEAERQILIDHCRIVNNESPAYTVYIADTYYLGNLTRITDTVFDNNTIRSDNGDYSVLLVHYGNNLEVSNTRFTNTQGKGRVIRVLGGGDYKNDTNYVPAYSTFDNVTIEDNTNCLYTPVYISNLNENYRDDYARYSVQASTTWSNCVLTNNASSTGNYNVGAFYVYKQFLTMENCQITNNKGQYGAVGLAGPLTSIGKGEQKQMEATFTGCKIADNEGGSAGGLWIGGHESYRLTVNLNNCDISNNTSRSTAGGIYAGQLTTLNMTETTVTGNTAKTNGGGLYMVTLDNQDGSSRINLTNCKITGNTAQRGGGIYMDRTLKPEKRSKDYINYYTQNASSTQTLKMVGGTVDGNTALGNGGGICTTADNNDTSYGTLVVNVTGGGTVENNRAQLGQDVYAFKGKPDTVLHLPQASAIHDNGRWLNENTSETLKDEPIDYDPIQRTYPLTLSVPKAETDVARIVETDVVYNSLQEAVDAARAMLAEDPNRKLTVELLKDTNSSTQISQDTNITLDLAGNSITGIGGKPALTIESNVAIVNSNSAKGGTISGTATDGGALLLRNNANVTMTDTTITNSRAAYRGGAVCVDSGSSFTLGRGSTITGCQAGRGGAVYVIDGSFTQTDGAVITNCKVFENAAFNACGYGGAVYVAKGSYTLQSGSVTNNSATQNGIIYIANNSGAEFTMTKGEISGNTCKNGTIYQAGGTMTLAGGSITGNTCTESGGGVYQNGGSSLLLGNTNASQDVIISGNKAVNGAGWYINDGNCLMRGGNITGNKATKRGGGVCQSNGTLTVNGGDITTNNAPEGGGLCHSGGTFNFQGGGLYGNIATGDDGGNDVYSTSKNGVMDLIAAAAMDSDKYNVWRDDYYPYTFTKNYHNTSDKIAAEGTEDGGKYLTSTVPNVNNVKLTADYYENSNIEIDSNDMYIYRMSITKQDTGDGEKDHYDAEDGLVTAADVLKDSSLKPDNVASVTPSTESYPLNYIKSATEIVATENYLTVTYTDGTSEENVRPNTPLAWTAGNDTSEKNALIRSFSTANYIVSLDTKSAGMGDKLLNATERLWMRIKVPCESGEISLSGNGTVFKSSYTYYDPESHCQILEGYQDHVIEEKDLGTMNLTMQFSIKVGGMHNGATVQPTIEAWFDNSSYQSYWTGTNPYDDRVVLDANPMRVSAKAAYNLSVANNPSLRHIGYFDMDTKTEITEAEYKKLLAEGGHNVVYGMMVGYGMSLQLRNQDTSKGLRGIEVPNRDITFDVNMQGGLKFNGKTVYYAEGGQPVAINPLLWAYKPNESGSYTGYDTRNNTAGINMNWSDEDDDDRSTHYDSKIAMNVDENHSGGTWTALNPSEDSTFTRGDGTEVKQTKLTFKVSGYTMRPISKSNDQAYSFSTGYLQVLIPLELDKYDFAKNDGYEGFLQTDMHMAGGNMTMDNVADADLNGVEAELTDKVNGYFNYTDEVILRSYAKNESTYGDNYDNSSTLGMNISRGWGGNASYITKTNYWLGSDGKTVLNDDQNKQLGTNVTGIASKVYMTGNLAFGSEEVTPANNTDKFIYDAQVDQQAEYYYLTAYDVLMKFDPSAMRPATYMVDGVEKPVYKMSQKEVAANLKDVTHISLSDNGHSEWDTTKQLTQNYELTILYAAKATDTPVLEDRSEGNGWQYARWERADGAGLDNSQPLWKGEKNTRDNGGTADMDKYSFNKMTVGSDEATKEIEGLVYYDTLTELEKAGHTCVAVLYQIRNCCVRTGRSVEIGHMMEVTKDVSKIGRSYALTMDVRGWTTYRPFYRSATATGSNPGWTRLMDNGTVLTKRSELLYQGLIEGKDEQAKAPVSHTLTSAKNSKINWDIGTPTISRITNNYQKTQYSNGYEVGGSHSGYLSGNTVLLATQNATVEIETTDVAEGNIRQTDYQLDEGQRTVTVQVTPRVTMQSNAKANLEVFDGTTQTDLTLDVKLPQDLTLQEGTLTFDYSNSSYNRGDLTWEAKYQYWDGTTWQDFDFATDYEQNYVQRPTCLHLTTTITDVKKVLPVLSFKAGIGYPADPGRDITGESDQDGAWYKNLRIDAEIHTTYEEENVNASLGRTDYTEIKVLRNSKTVVNKTAASNLVEIGDVLAYDLTYIKESGVTSNLELCDLLPYNTEKAKTFHGAYGLKSVTVTVQNADGSAINGGTDDITVKYAGTDSVAYNSKGVLDRATTMKNAERGTLLTTKTTKGNSVTFTPDTMPIHKATGTSELGSLYLQLKGLPNATVKVRVELAVTQTKDDVNALLTDSDEKTVQQSNDTYNNIYFARAGGEKNALLTSPTASIKVRSRSISGLVWMDQNYDGIYTTKLDDTGKKNVGSDKTLAGITVTLVQTEPNTQDEEPVYIDGGNSYYAVTDTLGNEVQPVTTISDGHYTFENLKQGEYRVLFTDSKAGYEMEDGSKPVLPFGKLSVTKHDDAMGDTSNKTAPQYGTKDANTLQAAMSEEITLGDAVLTGRDDKTNINAGFYYTELRLAKVWQNIPDAEKAAEAKVDFTLAATQDENKLEEAVYTLSNTKVSEPAKADENAENLALFGTFVGDKVDVTGDSAERTVRWQTMQGLPLQAENAKGPITYTLKQDTVRADGDTWIGNVSFVQQQHTEKVSSGAESDNSVIATRLVAVNTARIYEILIHKLSDVENKDLEKAEFTATLQPASPLEKLLGGKVEIKSKQTIQRTGENEETEEIRYRLTDLTAGTYTLAETKAPLGYAKDPVKYKLTITDRDENGNTLPTIVLEDDKGNLLYTAVMTPDQETGNYSVDVTAGDDRDTSTASAVMTAGSCLETMPKTEQEQSNLPIRTQISMEITDSYLFSLPSTGGSGMNRSLLQGVAVMALAAAAFAVTAIHRKKKNHS